MAFDPSTLLYLVPELSAYSNVLTVEDATAYNASNPSTYSNLLPWLPPADFDAALYLLDNPTSSDISHLDGVIRTAMSNSGLSPSEINAGATYLDFIKQQVTFTGSACNGGSTFVLNDPTFYLTACNLNVGDTTLVVRDSAYSLRGVVTHVTDSWDIFPGARTAATFSVSNAYPSVLPTTSAYLLQGLRVADVDRIGAINLVRSRQQTETSNLTPVIDPTFNYGLYQVLYPETRMYNQEECYVDWVAHGTQGDYRIGRASDIWDVNGPLSPWPQDSIAFRSNITIGGAVNLSSNSVITSQGLGNITFAVGGLALSNFAGESDWFIARSAGEGLSDTQPGDMGMIIGNSNSLLFGTKGSPSILALSSNLVMLNGVTVMKTLDIAGLEVNTSLTLNSNAIVQTVGPELDLLTGGVSLSNAAGKAQWTLVTQSGSALADSLSGDTAWTWSASNHLLLGVYGGGGSTISVGSNTMVVNGSVGADEFYSVSDRRVKTAVEPVRRALDALGHMGGYTYVRSDHPETTRRRRMGLIAQEVRDVAPEAVHEDADGRLSISYPSLTALLVEGVNALRHRLDAIEVSVQPR